MNLIDSFKTQFVIPVIRENEPAKLEGICQALASGGMKVLEVTLMSEAAYTVIEKLSKQSDLIVGAGTVLDVEQAGRALDCGAKFLISPGLNLDVVDVANESGAPVFPGVLTPSEIMAAQAEGCQVLKVFPISAVGGPSYLNSLKGPFPNLQFMPSGGITLENLGDYRRAGALAVGMGGKLLPADAVEARDWKKLTSLAADHLKAARSKI